MLNQDYSNAPHSPTPNPNEPGSSARDKSAEFDRVPSISLPKGGGAIKGIGEKFAANSITGTGSFTVPIVSSPGRSAFGPQLSLSYDSGSGNGPFGFGWGLSLPTITRKTDKGLPKYEDAEETDTFILSSAEDLVPVMEKAGGRWRRASPRLRDLAGAQYLVHLYRPRIEGLFSRIERWTNATTAEVHWRSISRANITTIYGKTSESRITDPDNRERIFKWLICESYDDKGNAVVYEYLPENDVQVDRTQASERNRVRSANRYLKRIKYGNKSSRLIDADLTHVDWMFEVVFDYDDGHYSELPLDDRPEQDQHRLVLASSNSPTNASWGVRPDPFSSYRAGFEIRTYRRCRRVLMFHRFDELGSEPYLVRATEFDYADLDTSVTKTIEEELAFQGSTRFASFVRNVIQSGFVSDTSRAEVSRDGVTYLTYIKKALPPLEFEYSKATIQSDIRLLDSESLENLPVGLDDATYRWVDLEGEGVAGILTEQADAWFYKPNLGEGRFGPPQIVASHASLAHLAGGRQQLIDLDGDGQLDLVSFIGPTAGFYERTDDQDWRMFKTFASLPNIPWHDSNLRFVDLNGDGHADVLITESEVFTWYRSLGATGFDSSRRVYPPIDEESGPRLVLAQATQSIYLADMCGDGLNDLVRVRNGEICYWPNLGYGRFGAKVSMDNAPWFDNPDQFDQTSIRFADIDGSGTSDILYLGRDVVRLYFNQSGNRWSEPYQLKQLPAIDKSCYVTVTDLLGNGTACLVWSSKLTRDRLGPVRYVDLMGGQKPHLLVRTANNLGSETKLSYAPSTKFYLADKLAGTPWITKIPFPVQVVERVEVVDRISGNRFVTAYSYHHGYFDGVEREFRGFGLVEQTDTEEYAALKTNDESLAATNVAEFSHIPPVLTRTWFHTGTYLERDRISNFFAGLRGPDDKGEYYRRPGFDAREMLLADTLLPAGLTTEEEREACRALKGSMLRQEVYALDHTPKASVPYTVTEQNFAIRVLQPMAENRHSVFLTHSRESLNYNYEREPNNPRIAHSLTLEVDKFGNVLKSASVCYGRVVDPTLEARDQQKQSEPLLTYQESDFTNSVEGDDDYRAPLASEARTYELTGYSPSGPTGRFQFSDFIAPGSLPAARPSLIFDSEIPYEAEPGSGRQRRLIECVRTLYRRNNLSGSLALGELQSLALPFEGYRLAFTPGLLGVYEGRVTSTMLAAEGRYVHTEGDVNWWIPSGRVFYSPATTDTPAQELAEARAHFFLARRYRNPFHTNLISTETLVTYDDYDLLIRETVDALDNRLTVIEPNADPAGPPVNGNDYRVLQPSIVVDANRNRSKVAFDALGLVVGTAIMGKVEDSSPRGDSLDGFESNLTDAAVAAHLQDPFASPQSLIQRATSRLVYDQFAYYRSRETAARPAIVYFLERETHDADQRADRPTEIRHSFSYFDGFGREIQKKIPAEAGRVPIRDAVTGRIITINNQPRMTIASVPLRWVGSGWTIFNNKGKPVRKFEPFFTDTHRFELDVRIGVSAVIFYDPLERVVGTLHPNHTWEKVVFDSWKQITYDVNDSVAAIAPLADLDPKNDPDVGDFFRRLPAGDYLPTWYGARIGGVLGVQEQEAAVLASVHAQTPSVAFFDCLGRTFLTVSHNRSKRSDTQASEPAVEEFSYTRSNLDIEGNLRESSDARDRIVMRCDFDLLGNGIHQASMEAGERWTLNDVAGKPLRAWDSRGHRLRIGYDQLRRPTGSFMREGAAGHELLVERSVYGETRPDPETSNLRGKLVQLFDQAGLVTSDEYDFKGNLLRTHRRLAREYKATLDWSAGVPLEEVTYAAATRYDALNRVIQSTAPHSDQPGARINVIQPIYNVANLLDQVHAWLDLDAEPASWLEPDTADLHAVTNIDYNAKAQRTRIDFGNRVGTRYEYDSLTYRLVHLNTARHVLDFPNDCPDPSPAGWPGCQVQDLHYTYDPSGNVTHIRDDAQQTVYFRNLRVQPNAAFIYDAIYRLIEANGREHLGQTAGAPNPPTRPNASDLFHARLDHPGDGNAMGRYIERYFYDQVSNITTVRHSGSDPLSAGWTREYAYNETSQLEAGKTNNRLSRTTIGADTEPCQYEGAAGLHGNITSMSHLPLMQWDYRDQLQATARQIVHDGVPETTWYVYDSSGQRVRKITERAMGAADLAGGRTPVRMKERIYLGGFEIYREFENNGDTVKLQRETLHLMDDKRRIALVETRTDTPGPEQLIRYQFSNHLSSASLELDDQAQIISYEEYYPYGSTSYQAVRNQTEAPKRYRFTGKERDEESGFYYHGARYYAAWFGRWICCDPAGLADGPNLFAYGHANPLSNIDTTGTQCDPTITTCVEREPLVSVDPSTPTAREVTEGRNIPSEHQVPSTSPQPAAQTGPVVSQRTQQQIDQEQTNRFSTWDLPPEELPRGLAFVANSLGEYSLIYHLKRSMYLPLRELIAPTPIRYISEGQVREYTGPRDHTDAIVALANVAMFAAPALGPARVAAATTESRTLLMVGPESQAEFDWLTAQGASGWETTAVNPFRTSAATSFEASGGRYVQGGVESVGETFNWTHESMPQPLGRTVAAIDANQARLNTVAPGGRLTVLTEDAELRKMYQSMTTTPRSPFTFSESLMTPVHPERAGLPPATSGFVAPGDPVWLLNIVRRR